MSNRFTVGSVAAIITVFLAFLSHASSLCAQSPAQSFEQLRMEQERRLAEIEARYQREIDSLQSELRDLRREIAPEREAKQLDALSETIALMAGTVMQDRAGLERLGQVTVFDNTFNPAISLIGDFVLSASSRDNAFESLNQFTLRSVELGITGRIDPHVAYVFILHTDSEELEVEESYLMVDRGLPNTFRLKAGQYNIDFGKLSPRHAHDLSFVDHPGVLEEFLGGSLRGTGAELHHWLPLGDTNLLRWSAGIVNALTGDSHSILGPRAGEEHHGEEEGAEPFGDRGLDDFAFTARVTTLFEVGDDSTLQIGFSGAYAPRGTEFFLDSLSGESVARDLEVLVLGFDATFIWLNEATGEGLELGLEALLSDRRSVDEDTLDSMSNTALGFYSYTEYHWDRQWSMGATFDWFERAENTKFTWWDTGAFLTYRLNEFNRLRLEARWIDDEMDGEEYFTVMLQWTTILGSHGHGVEW